MKTNAQQTYWISWGKVNPLLETVCFSKIFLNECAILNLLEIIQKALDDGQIACGIFIDLGKAFDTVSHDILLEELDHYGIRGISNDWFHCTKNIVFH